MLEARTALKNLEEYRPPLAGRQGLRLDFNESTVGCSPRVLACLRKLDAEALARYPERSPVESQVATAWGLDAAQVLLTNGVDEAIHLLCCAYLEPGDEAVIAVPTFAMYEVFAQAAGARVVQVRAGKDFVFPAEDLLARLSPRTRIVAVASPNNPTGAAASPADLLRLSDAAPDAAVLVDEAYFEFHGETIIDEVKGRSNLFVARTFSKAYGLAGLRIGVLVGNGRQMRMVRRAASPYNVNVAGLAVLPEAIGDREYVERYVTEVWRNRSLVQEELGRLGLRYWPSRANFVLAYIGEKHAELVEALRARGILVRDRSRDPGCAGCVRFTIGSSEHTRLFSNALREAVEELGLHREVRA
jgi:histidinol-phosphate aminotransferase